MNEFLRILIATSVAGALLTPGAFAANYEVHMVARDAKGRFAQFEPALLKVQPGDTVTFVSHEPMDNTQSVPELIPSGANNWTGQLGQNVTVTFDLEGLYVYKCLHHIGRGMVGIIQVGQNTQPLDVSAVERLPPKAEARLKVLLDQME